MIHTKTIAGAIAGLLVSAGAASALPAVAENDVNIRTGPGIQFAIIGVLPAGAAVDVGQCMGAWCLVNFGGQTGYVSQAYLSMNAPVASGYGEPYSYGYAEPYAYGYAEPYGYDYGVAPAYGYDYGYSGYEPGFGFGVTFGDREFRERQFQGRVAPTQPAPQPGMTRATTTTTTQPARRGGNMMTAGQTSVQRSQTAGPAPAASAPAPARATTSGMARRHR